MRYFDFFIAEKISGLRMSSSLVDIADHQYGLQIDDSPECAIFILQHMLSKIPEMRGNFIFELEMDIL